MQIQNHIRKSTRGFTLIELLVVIALISALLSIGISTLKSSAASKGVNTGISIAQGVFDNARERAKNIGVSRVVIYADTGGDIKDRRERYLKYIAVAAPHVIDADEDHNDPENIEWRIVATGETLPRDTFFNVNLCPGVPKGRVKLGDSYDDDEDEEKDCYYYEFNAEGALVSSPDNDTETRFIIQLGTISPGDDVPTAYPTRLKDAGGFAIWKSGRTSVYRSIKQIEDGNISFE